MDNLYKNTMTADLQRNNSWIREYPTISLLSSAGKNAYRNAMFTEKKVQCHVCGIEYSRTASATCPMCEMRKDMGMVMQVIENLRKQMGEHAVVPINVPVPTYDKCEIMHFGFFNGTPIEWLILRKKEDRSLILSKYGLEVKAYNLSRKNVAWEKSEIRRYLNIEFYEKCFNEKEKNLIKSSLVVNKDNPIYRAPGGPDTRDKIFLMSVD